MTATSRLYSRSSKLTLVFGMVLIPFGPVPDLLKTGQPWRGFDADESILTVARAENVPLKDARACSRWIGALSRLDFGTALGPAAWKKWSPWSEDDREAVDECDSFPCDVKLDQQEIAAMTAAAAPKRHSVFMALTNGRAQEYLQSSRRKACEYPGPSVDPWARGEAKGFKSGVSLPVKPDLRVRRLDFGGADSEMRPLRQILDRRFASSPREGALWVRDVYTTHYFDSWGEWIHVACDGSTATVTMALIVDLDLLKKTDLISRLARGKMRSAVETNGAKHLDVVFATLKKHAAPK